MPFGKVVGHSQQISFIKELVRKGGFPQSCAFSGPEGIGKRLVATETAKLLTGRDDLLNVRFIGTELPPKIDDVREAILWLRERPVGSPRKVLIVDRVEEARTEALNALLKILEEPPDYAFIVLITSNISLLPKTVVSRLRVFRFSRLTEKNVECVLERLGIEVDRKVLKLCGGSVGRAVAIHERNIVPLIEELLKLIRSGKGMEGIVDFSSRFSKQEETLLFIDALEYLLSKRDVGSKWFEPISRARLFLRSNVKPRAVIEWLLITVLLGEKCPSSI